MHVSSVIKIKTSTFTIFYMYQLNTYLPWFQSKMASVFVPRNSAKDRTDVK